MKDLIKKARQGKFIKITDLQTNKILKRNGSSWSFEDRELDESEKDLIIAESKYILKTTTWKILEKEIMWRANKEMYLHSTDTLGLTMGKSWQYVFDVLKSKLKDIVG